LTGHIDESRLVDNYDTNAPRAVIRDRSFGDQVVTLDGHVFERCNFEGSTMHYGGGRLPAFIDCNINGKMVLVEAAGRTAQ
jgi:hypothetical protein